MLDYSEVQERVESPFQRLALEEEAVQSRLVQIAARRARRLVMAEELTVSPPTELRWDSPRCIETPIKASDISAEEESPGYCTESNLSPVLETPRTPTNHSSGTSPMSPTKLSSKLSEKRPPKLDAIATPHRNSPMSLPTSPPPYVTEDSSTLTTPPSTPDHEDVERSPLTPTFVKPNRTPARCPDTPDRTVRKRNTRRTGHSLSIQPCGMDVKPLSRSIQQELCSVPARVSSFSRRDSTPLTPFSFPQFPTLDSPRSTTSLKAKPSFCGLWSGMLRRKSSSFGIPMSPTSCPMTPTTPATPMAPTRYFLEFEEECELGRGSFGVVTRVKSRKDGATYAIKSCVTHGEMHLRVAQQEVATLASCDNPHILKYYDSWSEGNIFYVKTECCDGSVVQSWPLGSPFWDDVQLLRLVYQMCTALHSLHSRGLAHMDVKPDNIYVASVLEDHLPVYKLGDFGLVRPIDPQAAETLALYCPELDDMEGDPRYLASEVLHTHEFLCEGDIFSLGASAYEIAIGEELPGHGDEWHTIRSGRPLPGLERRSPSLSSLLHRMLHPNPTMRPSAIRLILEIQQITDSLNLPDVLRGALIDVSAHRE